MALRGEGGAAVRLHASRERALGQGLHGRRQTGALVGHVHGTGMLVLRTRLEGLDRLVQQASSGLGRLGGAISTRVRVGEQADIPATTARRGIAQPRRPGADGPRLGARREFPLALVIGFDQPQPPMGNFSRGRASVCKLSMHLVGQGGEGCRLRRGEPGHRLGLHEMHTIACVKVQWGADLREDGRHRVP